MEITDYASLLKIHESYQRGDLKLLDKITVICVAANVRENYGCNLLLASGTTKKGGTADDMIPVFELVVEYLISDEVYEAKGPTSDFQSDGASAVKLAPRVPTEAGCVCVQMLHGEALRTRAPPRP